MIKASLPIEPDLSQAVEDALYEVAPSNWCLTVNKLDGSGKLDGFFANENEVLEAREDLESALGQTFLASFVLVQLEEEDWRESYKEHFEAWSRGIIHWVPEWERGKYPLPSGHKALYVDPGMAFGTGNHETTRLCLESMISILEKRQVRDCLDLGCGSGILSLSAILLGITDVRAIDNDPDAIRVSIDNASLNSMEERIEFQTMSLEELACDARYDLVLANVQADVLMENASGIIGKVRSGGFLVLSGILTEEKDLVRESFDETLSMDRGTKTKCREIVLNDWACLEFELANEEKESPGD